MIASVVSGIYIANRQIRRNEIEALQEFAERAVKQADLVQGQAAQALQASEALRATTCSHEYLKAIGRVTLSFRYVRDVGAYREDRYLCSSLLGDIRADGIELGTPDWTSKSGYRIWTTPRNTPGKPQESFLVGRNGHFVAVDPIMFVDLVDIDRRSIAVIDTETGNLIAKTPGSESAPMLAAYHGGGGTDAAEWNYVVTTSHNHPLTIVVRAKHLAAMTAGGWIIGWWALLGGLVGSAVAWGVLWFLSRQISMPIALKSAIKKKALDVHYQPIIDLRTGSAVGFEALVRWQLGNKQVPPDEFIALAEKGGLIQQLTDLVTSTALSELADVLSSTPSLYVSINASASDLETERFTQLLQDCCQKFTIAPRQVRVEITERSLIDTRSARETLKALQHAGHAIYIDDFGTGYSSLSYLHKFDVDALKIDKSFIDAIGRDSASSLIAPHVISMAQHLGIGVIAEGVELESQAAYLLAHGVRYAQGWLYARAMPILDLKAYLANQANAPLSRDAEHCEYNT
ncbi:EAL domain-containing protein [Pandoraea sp. SD6-2]|uniref:EAL domain-containing protein n=1 Tax=Pandoraea sp. SD6-2 TaxID=1286093 RepID=UPI00143AC095|nr:EAL domain-containing protein [Pandoraea sp. SD6-2]